MSDNYFDALDRKFQAQLAQLTSGISPAALTTSYYSWLAQLALSPGRVMELALYPAMHFQQGSQKMFGNKQAGDEADPRFKADAWESFPWNMWAQGFGMTQNWWQRATNPELFQQTIRTKGKNLVQGVQTALADARRSVCDLPALGLENFVVGKSLAITPGRVVFRNHLVELIQYAPQGKTVYKEPVLMLPAWIMKYYILDLSPDNSLVNWLVGQGHTVFMVSWRNPHGGDRDLGLDDYYRQGAMASLDFISALMPGVGIHLMGNCLGGTLAIITAAAMAGKGDERLESLTFLAAQADFTEAGQLMLFITESEVAFLKNMMWDKGYLDGKQMAGTFQLLHSSELIREKMFHDRMLEKPRGVIDLIA